MHPEDAVIDAIDALVDEQLKHGPLDDYNRNYYDQCVCGHDWHGIACVHCDCRSSEDPTPRRRGVNARAWFGDAAAGSRGVGGDSGAYTLADVQAMRNGWHDIGRISADGIQMRPRRDLVHHVTVSDATPTLRPQRIRVVGPMMPPGQVYAVEGDIIRLDIHEDYQRYSYGIAVELTNVTYLQLPADQWEPGHLHTIDNLGDYHHVGPLCGEPQLNHEWGALEDYRYYGHRGQLDYPVSLRHILMVQMRVEEIDMRALWSEQSRV